VTKPVDQPPPTPDSELEKLRALLPQELWLVSYGVLEIYHSQYIDSVCRDGMVIHVLCVQMNAKRTKYVSISASKTTLTFPRKLN